MRKRLLAIVLCLTSLAVTGCLTEYYEKLDNLKSRADSLQSICDELNTNVASLQKIVKAIENSDLITGISSITENGKTVGYKINFAKGESISIYNGVNGTAPIVGSKKDGDTYYWTIQYGDGPVQYIYDSMDNMIPAVGKLPKFRIVDGMWQVSYDTVEWVEVGKASGIQGDAMFKSIDATHEDYVLIYMADGTVFKIPTFNAYSRAKLDIVAINSNTASLIAAMEAIRTDLVYVTDCSPVVDTVTNKPVGTHVKLSNGKEFTVHNWTGTNVPNIYARMNASDSLYYWAVQYGDEQAEWVLDDSGAKVLAIGEKVEAPTVGMAQAEDGYYYWTVSYAGDTTVWLGRKEGVHAIDSVTNTIFKSVANNSDNLELKLLDGTVIKLPKQFYVELSASGTTHSFSGDTLTMRAVAATDTAFVNYRVYGATSNNLSFIAQGGFQAKESSGKIRIIAPASFAANQGKVVAIFNLDGSGSTKTVVKTIYIRKKEE